MDKPKMDKPKLDKRIWMKKYCLLVVGSVLSALGISLAIGAGFGSATLAVLWQGISLTFDISIGLSSFLIAIVMIIIAYILDHSQINIGTILYQILYSYSVNLFQKIIRYPELMAGRFLLMLLGIILFAAGTGLYAFADVGRGSYEALTFAVAKRTGSQVKRVRILLDILVVLSGVCLGGQVGLCTLVTIFCVGPLIQKTMSWLQAISKKST